VIATARTRLAAARHPGPAPWTADDAARATGTVDVVPAARERVAVDDTRPPRLEGAVVRPDEAGTARPDDVAPPSEETRASGPDDVAVVPSEESGASRSDEGAVVLPEESGVARSYEGAVVPSEETRASPSDEGAVVLPEKTRASRSDEGAVVLPDEARTSWPGEVPGVLPAGVAAALAAARAAIDPAGRFPFRILEGEDEGSDEAEDTPEPEAEAEAVRRNEPERGDRRGDEVGCEREGDVERGGEGGRGHEDEARGVGEVASGAPADPVGTPAGAGPTAFRAATSASSASTTPSGSAQVVDLRLEVDDLRPGPELAALVTAVDPASASDELLADLVAASERVAAWARASSAVLAAELSRRASMQTPVLKPRDALTPVQCTATELSMRLACSPFAAARLTRMGRAMTGMLTSTGVAFANGRIDERRAQVITDALAELPGPVAWDVEDRVLERAGTRTVVEVRSDVQRALVVVDPAEAVARARQARRTRRVEAPRRQADGMATLIAVLPAPQATGIYRVLDAAARTARAAGDPRTLEQLRADGLCDLTLGDDLTPADHPALLRGGRRSADQPTPITDDQTSTDVTPPPTGDRTPTDGVPVPARDSGCGHDRPARRRPAVVTRLTMPLSTLLGVDDQPADLEGYGAIDPVTARALAAGGVFQRMVTDPLSGTLLDLGRTTYRPSTALAEHVQARDGTCRHPACSVPATSCDLDHTRDYHQQPDDGGPPGTTSHDNLGPLCRRHHRMKSEAGFRLRQSAPGEFEWLTPTGHRYAVAPEPLSSPPEPEPEPPPF
jgi:hypothetical protein